MRRTVKVSFKPRPLRPMTIPAKIWIRSLSPSTTRVCTRTPSPILNLAESVLNCSFSIASIILFIMNPPGGSLAGRTLLIGQEEIANFIPAHDHDQEQDVAAALVVIYG